MASFQKPINSINSVQFNFSLCKNFKPDQLPHWSLRKQSLFLCTPSGSWRAMGKELQVCNHPLESLELESMFFCTWLRHMCQIPADMRSSHDCQLPPQASSSCPSCTSHCLLPAQRTCRSASFSWLHVEFQNLPDPLQTYKCRPAGEHVRENNCEWQKHVITMCPSSPLEWHLSHLITTPWGPPDVPRPGAENKGLLPCMVALVGSKNRGMNRS